MLKLCVSALVILLCPLWLLGFIAAVAHGAWMGGYDVARDKMEKMLRE